MEKAKVVALATSTVNALVEFDLFIIHFVVSKISKNIKLTLTASIANFSNFLLLKFKRNIY